jgi:hypothetical protein
MYFINLNDLIIFFLELLTEQILIVRITKTLKQFGMKVIHWQRFENYEQTGLTG